MTGGDYLDSIRFLSREMLGTREGCLGNAVSVKHWWFSGIIAAADPGSIPGQCSVVFCWVFLIHKNCGA